VVDDVVSEELTARGADHEVCYWHKADIPLTKVLVVTRYDKACSTSL
jgi:hypothetical protein